MSGASIEGNAHLDKLLTRDVMEFFRSCWLDGTGVKWTEPQVNLLSTSLSGLPGIAIYYGEFELLASDAVALFAHATEAGNDAILRQVDEGQHSFIMGAGRVPEVDQAIDEMGRWLRSRLGLESAVA